MERERPELGGGSRIPAEIGSEWTEFIQQQIQTVFQSALPHMVHQISERAMAPQASPSTTTHNIEPGQQRQEKDDWMDRESKVAAPDKFVGKKGGEVYRWFAQIRLVFRSKPQMYKHDEDKISYALSYMSGAAQNWAMPLLQALDEGRQHKLLTNYDAFREAVISVYGDLDRRGNAEDRLAKIKQTGSVAAYVSSFNEHAAQVDWNEPSLVARFRAGLKDEILHSVATAETQPRGLQDWIAMASRIDQRLWARRQARRPSSMCSSAHQGPSSNPKSQPFVPMDHAGRFQTLREGSGPVPMELDATHVSITALAKTAAERLEYQRHGRCWGCGEIGHVRAKCPVNPSKPLSLAALEVSKEESGKGLTRD